MVSEAVEDILSWDSRAARTIAALMFKPGFLTREYLAGRRARYVPPLRLYLFASVAFFFLISVESFFGVNRPMIQIYHADTGKTSDVEIADPARVRKDVHDWIYSIHFDSLSAATNDAIHKRVEAQAVKASDLYRHNSRELINAVLNVAPPVVFLLVPVFALLLKLAYLGSGRYYTEHLVLSVHNHSFLFIMFIVSVAVGNAGFLWPAFARYGHSAINLWILAYLYISLLKTYGQGYFVTFAKMIVMGFIYIILLALSTAVAIFMGIMTL